MSKATAQLASELRKVGVPNAGAEVENWVAVASGRILEAAHEKHERGEIRHLPSYLVQVLRNGSLLPAPIVKPQPVQNARSSFQEAAMRHDHLVRAWPIELEPRVVSAIQRLEADGCEVTLEALRALYPSLPEPEFVEQAPVSIRAPQPLKRLEAA